MKQERNEDRLPRLLGTAGLVRALESEGELFRKHLDDCHAEKRALRAVIADQQDTVIRLRQSLERRRRS